MSSVYSHSVLGRYMHIIIFLSRFMATYVCTEKANKRKNNK